MRLWPWAQRISLPAVSSQFTCEGHLHAWRRRLRKALGSIGVSSLLAYVPTAHSPRQYMIAVRPCAVYFYIKLGVLVFSARRSPHCVQKLAWNPPKRN